ncbi:MAG: putative HAD superfamily Cof-like phosphohydrolase [Saprospiraceae bacterium]|jgi:predicted HAD superfamily Cof-like phosphohydrolase
MKYNEPNGLNDVAKFHETFSLPVLDTPIIPDEKRCELRVSLLQEELNELKEAIATNDLVEVADALCDIQYVLSGAILEFGMADKFKILFDEVQRSNMSKTCKTMAEAETTQRHYLETKGTESFIEPKDGEFLVYRTSDKKVLKSVEYSPADIKGLIANE